MGFNTDQDCCFYVWQPCRHQTVKLTLRILSQLSNLDDSLLQLESFCRLSVYNTNRSEAQNVFLTDIDPICTGEFLVGTEKWIKGQRSPNDQEFHWVERSIAVGPSFFTDSIVQICVRMCLPAPNNAVPFDLSVKEMQLLVNDRLVEQFDYRQAESLVIGYEGLIDLSRISRGKDKGATVQKGTRLYYLENPVLDVWSNGTRHIAKGGSYLMVYAKTPVRFYGGTQILLPANHIMFMRLQENEWYHTDDTSFEHDWFHCACDTGDEDFFSQLDLPLNVPLPLQNGSLLVNMMKSTLYNRNAIHRNPSLVEDLKLKLFFVQLSELIHCREDHMSTSPYNQIMHAIRREIYAKPQVKWSLALCAKKAMMSESYFQKHYHLVFGRGFSADVIDSRIQFASEQLENTNLPIAEIAELAGYETLPHFVRQFSMKTGLPPRRFRQLKRIQAPPIHMDDTLG